MTGFTDIDLSQQYPSLKYEATSTNDFVLHFTVQGSDTLQSISIDNLGSNQPAEQPRDLSAVRLILDPDGNTSNGSTTLGTFNVDSTSLHWTLNLPTPVAVSDGDHLYVAVDVAGPVTNGGNHTINMSIPASGAIFTNSTNIPASNFQNVSDMLLTTAQALPAFFNVALSDTMPSTIAIGQSGVPFFQFSMFPSTPQDAYINLKTLRMFFYDGNNLINPVTVISSMAVTSMNPQDGVRYFYGPIASYVRGDNSLSLPLTLGDDPNGPSDNYPYMVVSNGVTNTGFNNTLQLFADFLPNTSLNSFRVVVQSPTDMTGVDPNTGNVVHAAGSFPLQSSSAAFQYPATIISAVLNASGATTQVSKGSTGNSAFQIVLNNPGATSTGIAQLTKLSFTLTDGSGNAVTPNTALRWIHIDDGRFTYLSRSVTESTGNAVFCDNMLLPVNLAISNPVTLFVKYDVVAGNGLPTTLQFHVPSFAGWTVIQAGNNSSSVSITGSPFNSPSIPVVALFQVTHASRVPPLIVKGQKAVPFLDLSLNHPGPDPVGPVLIHSLAFHLQDRNGAAVEAANAFQNPRLQIGDTIPDQTFSFSGNKVTIAFSSGITLNPSSPGNTAVLSFLTDISSSCPSDSLELRLESPNDFAATQPSDLNRIVFAQAYGDTYPMTTGVVSLQSIDLKGSFTNFPNPFKAETGATRFTYWLTQSGTVHLRIFSLAGIPVRKLITGESRNAGLNTQDTWDGRNDSGRMVLNGVYLAVLEVDASGAKSTVKRFVAVVK